MQFLIWMMAFIGISVIGFILCDFALHIHFCLGRGRDVIAFTEDEYIAVMNIYKSHMHVKKHYENLARNK